MNKIDISTDDKKKEVFELFNSFSKKQEIYEYFKISDNTSGKGYIEKVAAEIGFDFNTYKNRKKRYCLFCGRELKRGQTKFCSCSCSAKYNNEGKKLGEETKENRRFPLFFARFFVPLPLIDEIRGYTYR